MVMRVTAIVAVILGVLSPVFAFAAPLVIGDPEVPDLGLEKFKNVIRAVCEYQGRTWVGTYGAGLYSIGPDGVNRYTRENSPLLENRVNVLDVCRGNLWIGTCAGFSIFDGKTWRAQTARDGVSGNIYHAILVDPQDRVWAGTAGNWLSVLESGHWRTVKTDQGLMEDWINALALDPSGTLWVATANRVFRKTPFSPQFHEEGPNWLKLPAAPTSVACRGNEVWVGSAFAGLAMHQNGVWYQPPVKGALPSIQVNALATDGSSRLWVGTAKGIASYHPQEGWKTFGTKDGLVDLNIRTLYFSRGSGRLWAGSFLDGWVYVLERPKGPFQPVLHAGVPVGSLGWMTRKRRE